MIHDRLSVHSVCFGTDDMDALFRDFATVGAGAVSLSSGQVLAHGAAEVRALAAAGGHRIETLTHLMVAGPIPAAPSAARSAGDTLLRATEAAATLGARSLYMLTGGRGGAEWDEAADRFATIIGPAADQARRAGIVLAVENASPLYADLHICNTLRDTVTLAERTGLGVCADLHACWTEGDLLALLTQAAPILTLVQVSDHVPGDRCVPCRAVPGDGAIEWRRLIGHIEDMGYGGTYDLELIGPRIVAEGAAAAVTRAAAYVAAVLDRRASPGPE